MNALAAESPYARLESLDKRFDALIAPDTKIEKIADDLLWSEGPLWDAKRKTLLFSDIPRNVIMQWNADKGVSSFLERSGYTGAAPFTGYEPGSNGLTFDLQGRLTLCQHGDRRVSRREADGTMVPLAAQLRRQEAQQPERPGVRRPGRAVFHRSAFRPARHIRGSGKELPFNARVPRRHGRHDHAVATDLEAPNGLGFSPDYKTLYVANARASSPIWKAYACQARWQPRQGSRVRRFAALYKQGDGVPDGLKVDVQGNVFATGPGGVLVYAPDGTLLGRILTGVPTANVAFGEDGATLFITANHRVLRLRTQDQGHAAARRHKSDTFITKGNP